MTSPKLMAREGHHVATRSNRRTRWSGGHVMAQPHLKTYLERVKILVQIQDYKFGQKSQEVTFMDTV